MRRRSPSFDSDSDDDGGAVSELDWSTGTVFKRVLDGGTLTWTPLADGTEKLSASPPALELIVRGVTNATTDEVAKRPVRNKCLMVVLIILT
jgi:hypothetical protein